MRLRYTLLLALITVGAAGAQEIGDESWTARVDAPFGRVLVEYDSETLYDPDRSTVFARPGFIALDGRERIYVTDVGDTTMVGLSPDGEHRFTVGGPGQGPGEMQDAWQIATGAGDEVLVLDRFAQALHVYDSGGQYLDSVRIPGLGMTDPKSFLSLGDDEFLIAAVTVQEPHADHPLHRFALEREGDRRELRLIESFGELEEADLATPDARWLLLGGTVTLDRDGALLYSQQSPFSLRKIATDGTELWRIDDPDAWRHWSEFMVTLPDGRTYPSLATQSRGVWPVGDGLYLHQIAEVTEEYRTWRQRNPTGQGSCDCEISRVLHELLWIDRGAIARKIRYEIPNRVQFMAMDGGGFLYGNDGDSTRLFRTRIRVRIQ